MHVLNVNWLDQGQTYHDSLFQRSTRMLPLNQQLPHLGSTHAAQRQLLRIGLWPSRERPAKEFQGCMKLVDVLSFTHHPCREYFAPVA